MRHILRYLKEKVNREGKGEINKNLKESGESLHET